MAVVDEIVEAGGGGGGGGSAGGEQQGQQGQQLPRFVGGLAVGPSMVSVSMVGRGAVDSSVLAGGEGEGEAGLEGAAAEGGKGWSELALVVGKALVPVVVINVVGVRAFGSD